VSGGTARGERGNRSAGGTEGLAGNFSSLQARSAHVQTLWGGTDEGANSLNVWIPAATGAAVRVGNAVAEARAFATDLTVGSHSELLIISWSGFAS
jgi:hypothetical protein